MKKDRIEQFIAENRERLDIYDPDEKIWDGIQKKLHQERRFPRIKTILWWAAVILVVFSTSFLLQEYRHRNDQVAGRKDKKLQKVEIPELMEAEIYYTNMVDEKINELQPLLKNQPELGNDLLNDLAELDSIYRELQKDLTDNIANDEVVEAMIQNYRLKLQILEDFRAYLQENSNHEKDEMHEYDL